MSHQAQEYPSNSSRLSRGYNKAPRGAQAPFDHVPVAVEDPVEDGRPTTEGSAPSAVVRLVAALGDRDGDAPAPQHEADRPAGIGLVAQHTVRCRARAARDGARDTDPVEDLTERGGVVDVAGREHDRERQAAAVDGQVDLGGQSASGAAEGLARLRAARIFQFVPVCGPLLRAPAACWWARLIVESTATVHSTRPTASSRTWTCSSSLAQVPSVSQREKRS